MASHSPESTRPRPPLSRRRDKPQLSCTLCRRRRLKCDRGLPCEACARRGLSLSCTYPAPTPLQSGKRVIPPSSTTMHDRVVQLEHLVLLLKDRADDNKNDEDDDHSPDMLSRLPKSFGRISLENTETSYVESPHWMAILDEIAELKDYFDDVQVPLSSQYGDQNVDTDQNTRTRGPALVLGDFKRLNRAEILAAIPPRHEADRLVVMYFNSKDVTTHLIHGPTFLDEYDRFWDCPQQASTMWIGLLFATLCFGAIHQQLYNSASASLGSQGSDTELEHRIQIYRDRVVQCLALADYTRCVAYTVETLVNYLAIEYLNVTDSQTGVWVLLGMIVRIAVRMGYHRDGSYSSSFTPFQVEMRRRVWAVLFQLDSGTAGQFGLPRMINESQSDTAEPLDVSDEALSPDMKEWPPPRSADSEPSCIRFLLIKNRLLKTFNMVIDLTGSPSRTVSYNEVMKLDKIIGEQFAEIPIPLRIRPMSRSLMDTTDIIINRIILALTSYASRCVLHRQYMLVARSNDLYSYSRKTCIEVALEILQIQSSLHEESLLGRRLYAEKWKFATVINHVFLLATTILCVDIDYTLRENQTRNILDDEISQKVLLALTKSYRTWLESSRVSRESQKIAEMLRIVLGKAQKLPSTDQSSTATSGATDQPSLFRAEVPSPLVHDQSSYASFSTADTLIDHGSSFQTDFPTMIGIDNIDSGPWAFLDWTGASVMEDIIRQSEDWAKSDPL